MELGFAAAPTSLVLRERLESTYAAADDWGSVASLYETEAQTRTEKRERIGRLRDAASVWRMKAANPTRAADVLRRARAEDQDDVGILKELVETLTASGDKAGAVLELSLGIDWFGDENAATAGLLEQRASLRAKLGDEDGSLFDLEHAFRVGGSVYAPAVILSLEGSCRRRGSPGTHRGGARCACVWRRFWRSPATRTKRDSSSPICSSYDAKDREALRSAARLEERAEKWDAASATYRRLVALEDSDHVVETAAALGRRLRARRTLR